jgi:hypothetical protein
MFSEDFVTNEISVGCFDLEKGDELVGIVVSKDLNFIPEGFENKYLKKMNVILPIMELEEKLIHLIPQQYQPFLTQTGVVMDLWGGAIKK